MNDTLDRLRLIRAEGVGPQTYRRLMARFRTAAEAIAALPALAKAGGRSGPLAVPHPGAIRRELESHDKRDATLLFLDDKAYPPLLALLPDAPPVLIVLGDSGLLSRSCIAIVGARNATANGRRIAEDLAAELARTGQIIVSGLARGIDGAAHRGAMAAGQTIAAIPGGPDIVYPPEHKELQAEIAERGAVVAEAPPGTAPLARHFPKRNRIIAGLSLGVVVIEAAPRSGSLLTARLAMDYGRELFAVPGSPLDPRSRGANDLIRQGAHLTESAADIMQNLPDHPARAGLSRDPLFRRGPVMGLAEPAAELDPGAAELRAARREVPNLLGSTPLPVDELARQGHISIAALAAVLMELELAGRIETLPGNRVALLAGP